MTTTPNPTAGDCGCPDFALSRRRLLASAAAAGAGAAGVTFFGDTFQQVAYGAPPGGNVLVVLSLRGGMDGLSLVVPRGADNDRLRAARPTIGIPQDRLIGGDARFGLHPALEPLLPMWQAGTFGAVHAIGLPTQNRSHFSAMEQIEDADPGSSARVGWINRLIGVTGTMTPDALQIGDGVLPTALVGPAPVLAASRLKDFGFGSLGKGEAARMASLHRMWDKEPGPAAQGVRIAMRTADVLRPLTETDIPVDGFPSGPLQAVLANTAALIKADIGTRVVTVDYGDWDMHVDVGSVDNGWFRNQAAHLAGSLAAFFTALGEAAARVTVVTISEFGRRVEQNSANGLDHGYGNAMLLLGAGVAGGKVAGTWPGLASLADGDVALGQDYRSVLWEVVARRYPELSGSRARIFPGFVPESVGIMM